MADKYHSDTQEKIETITYFQELQDSGDLEVATRTITATSKPGTADYSKSLTLSTPDDSRLMIKRIAARLQVTRDSGTSNNLYCSVYVDDDDGSEADHCLYDSVDVKAANLQVVDVHADNKASIFSLLKDGLAHTFYFFFWVDSGDSVISLVQLWEGVGTCATGSAGVDILAIHYQGYVSGYFWCTRQGSGTPTAKWKPPVGSTPYDCRISTSGEALIQNMLADNDSLALKGSVSTDLNYPARLTLTLRNLA